MARLRRRDHDVALPAERPTAPQTAPQRRRAVRAACRGGVARADGPAGRAGSRPARRSGGKRPAGTGPRRTDDRRCPGRKAWTGPVRCHAGGERRSGLSADQPRSRARPAGHHVRLLGRYAFRRRCGRFRRYPLIHDGRTGCRARRDRRYRADCCNAPACCIARRPHGRWRGRDQPACPHHRQRGQAAPGPPCRAYRRHRRNGAESRRRPLRPCRNPDGHVHPAAVGRRRDHRHEQRRFQRRRQIRRAVGDHAASQRDVELGAPFRHDRRLRHVPQERLRRRGQRDARAHRRHAEPRPRQRLARDRQARL